MGGREDSGHGSGPGAPVREEIPENIPDSSASEPELGPEVHRRPPKQLLKKSRCSSPIMVELPRKKFRLHKGGQAGWWMGRRRCLRTRENFRRDRRATNIPTFAGYVGRRARVRDPRPVLRTRGTKPPRRRLAGWDSLGATFDPMKDSEPR